MTGTEEIKIVYFTVVPAEIKCFKYVFHGYTAGGWNTPVLQHTGYVILYFRNEPAAMAMFDGIHAGDYESSMQPYTWVDYIEVRKKYRRRGYGKYLLDAVASFSSQNGAPAVMLHADTSRLFFKYYPSLGFTPCGRRSERNLIKVA